eukprot:gnl/TRDRNA2_/TRDRNA2_172529_c0_seq1.p1 gnl/TRDRNA2_/TRDRNA2_172529_c0~~gnl/TRDRNA2_/TRDRNA2_172529_c0_seq1.p1  ORF type:complete len:147 (+),score=27.47 gnl/TRDRNA2_/TRDRNA2_172529_c0_seq1:93-533(+)
MGCATSANSIHEHEHKYKAPKARTILTLNQIRDQNFDKILAAHGFSVPKTEPSTNVRPTDKGNDVVMPKEEFVKPTSKTEFAKPTSKTVNEECRIISTTKASIAVEDSEEDTYHSWQERDSPHVTVVAQPSIKEHKLHVQSWKISS